MTTPLVRIRSLTGYVALVQELGADPCALLDAQHISPALLGDEEAVVPYASVIRLFETTARATGRRDFGLMLSRRQDIEILGPLSLVVRNAATVREGLEALASHLHFYSPAIALYFEDEGNRRVRYVIDINVPGVPQRSQAMDLSLAIMNAIVALVAGKDFRAERVMFRHDAEAPESSYRSVFRCPACFDQPLDALVFRREFLERRIDQNDPLLRRTIESYVAQIVAAKPMDVCGQVEAFVRRLLPARECSLQAIAEHVSMHSRTLQRRLEEDGSSFARIVDEVRRERALLYLAQRQMPLTQVAGLLGYTEQSSFNRACVRWFDTTPLRMRKALRKTGGDGQEHGRPQNAAAMERPVPPG